MSAHSHAIVRAVPTAGALAAQPGNPAAFDGSSLSRRTLDAFAWRLLSEISKVVLQLAVQITLARLVPVEAFGLLAVALVIVDFGTRLSELGTAPAVIQRASLTETHIRVAFSLSVLSGALSSLAIWLCAPLAASVFHVDAVTPVLRVIGLLFVFGSLGTTAEALMQRRMDYRRLLRVELLAYGAGYAVVGIALALLNYGVWALAWATLAQAIVKSVALLVMSPHPVRPCFARTEARQLLNFGIGMTLSRLATFAAQNADYFVVARWLGTAALGFYSRAYQLMCQPIYKFSSNLNTVLFPAYSSIQSDAERLRRGYLTSLSMASIVVFPVFTAIAIVAPELMTGVFGPQWAPAGVPLQILCVAGACYCIYNLADSLVRAKGAVYIKFVYHSIYAACVLGGAVVGTRWDLVGVSIGVSTATAVVYLLMAHLSLRLTDCRWRLFFLAQWPAVAVSGAVALVGLPLVAVLRVAELPALAVLGGTTAAAGVAAIAAVLSLPSRWFSPAVLSAIGTARKHVLEAVATARRRYQPETI